MTGEHEDMFPLGLCALLDKPDDVSCIGIVDERGYGVHITVGGMGSGVAVSLSDNRHALPQGSS